MRTVFPDLTEEQILDALMEIEPDAPIGKTFQLRKPPKFVPGGTPDEDFREDMMRVFGYRPDPQQAVIVTPELKEKMRARTHFPNPLIDNRLKK